MGGWRGPVGHLDGGPALAKNWVEPLGADGAAAGHAAGLEARRRAGDDRQRGTAGLARYPGQTPQPRTGTLPLSDIAWARPVRDGKPGPAPRRMTDVMQQGDVVMVEPNAAPPVVQPAARTPSRRLPPLPRLALRQIPAGPGRAGVARSDHRAGARDGRRLELRRQPVQPRHAGTAPAGIQLQAVRLSDRAGKGHLAQPALPRCADRDGHRRRTLAAEQLRDGVRRPDAAAHRSGEARSTW